MPQTTNSQHSSLPAGIRAQTARVRVPASSANLGPGFDSLGLALAIYDDLAVTALPAGRLEIDVTGAGAEDVPRTEEHLVVQAIRAGLLHAGITPPGLRLTCRNAIPHGRGLGSSASAVVAGLVAARGLLVEPERLDQDDVLALADGFEGHPDNVAASVLGGCTVSWVDQLTGRAAALRIDVHPDVIPVACVPADELATAKARAMLPAEVPHADAAFNAGRAALLVAALGRRPDLLHAATEDRLHQAQRAPAMPATVDLVRRLRALGLAAVISGAGPTVLVFAVGADQVAAVGRVAGPAWEQLTPGVDTEGTVLITESD